MLKVRLQVSGGFNCESRKGDAPGDGLCRWLSSGLPCGRYKAAAANAISGCSDDRQDEPARAARSFRHPPPPRLRATDLVVRRGARTIIAGLSLDVAPGDVLLLRGPNGAGKTTLLRALAGLLPVAAGSIALEGADGPLELAESCHYVGHRNGLKAALTVAENAAFWGAYLDPSRGEDLAAGVDAALDRFGLAPLADIPAGYLSAGQQRRLALTRLVLAHRPVWLLDEPTVSLDASAALLAATIEAHVGAGGIAVAATHVELGLNAARELRLGAGRRRMRARARSWATPGAAHEPFATLLKRDLRLAVREGGAIGTALGFYLVVVALIPLGLGPDLKLLSRIAPGVLWIALLLSALLSLGRVFETDYEDGSLEVMATGPLPLELVAAAKSIAHWLSTAVPLTLMAPLLGLLLNLELAAYPLLVLTMLVGTPAISFLGAIGAALTLGARRGGLLIALLVLPLYVPT